MTPADEQEHTRQLRDSIQDLIEQEEYQLKRQYKPRRRVSNRPKDLMKPRQLYPVKQRKILFIMYGEIGKYKQRLV